MDWIAVLIIIGLIAFIFWLLKPDRLTASKLKKYFGLLFMLIVFLILLLVIIGNSL